MLAQIRPGKWPLLFLTRIERDRGTFLYWVPILLAIGIGIYFLLPVEPTFPAYVGGAAGIALCLWGARRRPWGIAPLAQACALVLAGVILAGGRAHFVAGPVLDFHYYGAVEGRVTGIDRSQSNAPRLTLDEVRLAGVAPAQTPRFVRISLHGDAAGSGLAIGLRVATTAYLSGPNGPVEPQGFDFQRMAWFRGIGAVGYTRTPVLALDRSGSTSLFVTITRWRLAVSRWVQGILPGDVGAFAAAITTGDRSGISQAALAALRGANLAHLLAISGLHMGLLTGFIYQAARYAMALFPAFALRRPTKKIAALLAIGAGAFYLAMSGGNVATERAFVMVSTMFVGILFDRRALSLRAVAIAATIVLILRPESLTEPGFQMSFAATTALIAVFGWLRPYQSLFGPRWLRAILTVVITSAVAAAATAPIAAAHFNQISHYGLLANLLCVPLMGTIIMPAAVLAALLAPFGGGWIGIALMGPPIRWIIAVADYVTSLEGAVGHVPQAPPGTLALYAIGGLMVVLLTRWEKALAAAPLAVAALIWGGAERPPVLISPTGGLVGVMADGRRALSKPRGEGFAARIWLENDGAPMAQERAFSAGGFHGKNGFSAKEVGTASLVHLNGKRGARQLDAACARASLVVMNRDLGGQGPPGCKVIDAGFLRRTGAVALWPEENGWRIETARVHQGKRLWTRW